MTKSLAAALFLFLPLAATAYAADDTYPIRFDRSVQPGDAFELHINASRTEALKQTQPGTEPQNKNQMGTADLTARLDVLEVDQDGLEKSFTLTVKKFTVGILALDLLPAGKIVKAARTPAGCTFAVDGKNLDGEALALLTTAYAPLAPEKFSIDAHLGTKTPRKVNDTWPFNAELLAARFTAPGNPVTADSLKGQTTLKALETFAGIQALCLITGITTESKPNTPIDGGTILSQATRLEFQYLLPLQLGDPVLERITSSVQLQTFSMTAPAGATLEVANATTITMTYTPIQPRVGMARAQIPAKFKPAMPATSTATFPATPSDTLAWSQSILDADGKITKTIKHTLTLRNNAIAEITATETPATAPANH